MRSPRFLLVPVLFACTLGLPLELSAQTPSSEPGSDQTVLLNPFEVSAGNVGPYQATAALAGGRISQDLFQTSDNVSIVTQQFMQDTGAADIYNATKYLAGIANNSYQINTDRVSIRGFQGSPADVDGLATNDPNVKYDPNLYERVEFVRGPDSLLSPSGSPGGTINLVSKVARFDDFETVGGEYGEYDVAGGYFDVNRVLLPNVAFRLVGSVIDTTQGDNQGYHESVGVEPSVLFKLGPNSQLLLHFTYIWGSQFNYQGLPINPATHSLSDTISMLPGINPYETPYADNSDDPSGGRHANQVIYRALFTTSFTDNFSMRLNVRYMWDWETSNQWNLLGNPGGGYDPLTGYWTPGLVWSSTAPYTSSPAPATTDIYTLSQSPSNYLTHYLDIQNDWVYDWKTNYFDSNTLAGFAVDGSRQMAIAYGASSPAINVYDIPTTATWTVSPSPKTDQVVFKNWEQLYLSEKLKFWNDHILINGSVVPTWFYEELTDYIAKSVTSSHPDPTFVNYGIDYVPIKWLSIYYAHSEDATQNAPSAPTATNPNPPPLQSGEQDEGGLRFRFLDGRATASVCYFDLHQTNNSIINPAQFANPPPTITPPNLYANRFARGWEFEWNVNLNRNLSFLGNYSTMKNRSPYDIPFRADPEQSGAGYVNYRFDAGVLNGLNVGLGYVWQSAAAGDSASGVTAASTPSNQIPEQASYNLPSYGLLNFTSSYRVNRHLTVRFFLDNALNKFYYAGSSNNNAVLPGIPRNPRGSVTYTF